MSLPVSSAPPVPAASPSPPLLPKDVPWEVQQEIRNLQSEDESTVMKSAASLVMLANLSEAEPHLGSCDSSYNRHLSIRTGQKFSTAVYVPGSAFARFNCHLEVLLDEFRIPFTNAVFREVGRLVSFLVGDYSIHVQRNACAALTAIMNASTILYHTVAEAPDLVKGLLKCLNSNLDDAGLQINALAAINVLSQQDQGLALIEEAGIADIMLSLLGCTLDATLEEEAVDTFCALAAHEKLRPNLLDKGAIPKLTSHMGTSSTEVCVRVLLALGMLCGSSLNAQLELASTDGAVRTLMQLTKSDDSDIRSISRDLFGTLVSNQEAHVIMEKMLRSS